MLGLVGACAHLPASNTSELPVRQGSEAIQSALNLLQELLLLDTSQPIEARLALRKIARELRQNNKITVFESPKSVVAHLPGNDEPPLVLYAHIDSRPWPKSNRSEATPKPGQIVEDIIFGPGVLGGKGTASLMTSVVLLLSENPSRTQPLYLVLTSQGLDPTASSDLEELFTQHPALARSDLAIIPGGFTLRSQPFFKIKRNLLVVGELGFARILLTASGPNPEACLAKVAHQADKLWPSSTYTPAAAEYLKDLAKISSWPRSWLMRIKPMARSLYVPQLTSQSWTRSMVVQESRITFKGHNEYPILVPRSEAKAWLDISILESETPIEKLSRIRETAPPCVHADLLAGEPALRRIGALELIQSPSFATYASTVPKAHWLRIFSRPTQARYLLRIGIPTYGFIPLEVSERTLNSRGEPDEHLPIASFSRAIYTFRGQLSALLTKRSLSSSTSAIAR